MANALYTAAKAAILTNTLDLENGDIRAILVDTGAYTVNLATHDNLDDIAAGARIGSAVALAGKTVTGGVFDADDVTFTAVTGVSVEAFVLYLHTGVEATSKLLMFGNVATGLPVTPSGADITIRWDAGANKIFALV